MKVNLPFVHYTIFSKKLNFDQNEELIRVLKSDMIANDKNQFNQFYPEKPTNDVLTKFEVEVCCFLESILENEYEYDIEGMSFEITSTWYNETNEKNKQIKLHSHPNSWFSAVYYPEGTNGTKITFINDNRPNIFMPKIKNFNALNSTYMNYEFEPNTLIIFPSWIQHFVTHDDDTKVRKSISCNIFPRGIINTEKTVELCI